jgi:D-serine deaminase-like pyridoxal phosphate-dependent protein
VSDHELHRPLIGRRDFRERLNTPALIVELEPMTRNIMAMAHFARAKGVALRPHIKTHKSPDIARLQIDAGAKGLCCAKIGEAEAMAEHGLGQGLHITSPVVSRPAMERLVALNERTEGLMCVVDNVANVRDLAVVAAGRNTVLDLIIDIDPGIRRTGVASAAAAVALLDAIRGETALRFRGAQCYCGGQQHIAGFDERVQEMKVRAAHILEIVDALTGAGAPPEIITGGGTGTHRIDVELGLFTELQVGSYIFMDREYLDCDLTGDASAPFEIALTVEARVVSNNVAGLATVDAGFKAFATDSIAPFVIAGAPKGTSYRFMGDEHGLLLLPDNGVLPLGALVTLGVPHCDPTVNLYDTYHVVKGGVLQELWPIAARGRSR